MVMLFLILMLIKFIERMKKRKKTLLLFQAKLPTHMVQSVLDREKSWILIEILFMKH